MIKYFSLFFIVTIFGFSVYLFGIRPELHGPDPLSRPVTETDYKPNVKVEITACYSCHGVNGQATLSHVPNLAGQPEEYLREQLKNFRSGDREHRTMNLISERLSDEQIDAIVEHYSNIPGS